VTAEEGFKQKEVTQKYFTEKSFKIEMQQINKEINVKIKNTINKLI
jgi:hypothetical protein